MDDRLKRLLDEQDVRDRVVRFHLGYDEGDWDAVRACVADDLTMEGLPVSGADTIIGLQRSAGAEHPEIRAQHILGNVVVAISGAEATASAYQTVYRCDAGAVAPPRTAAGTRNHYRLRRDANGGWLITFAKVDPVWLEGEPVHG